MRRQAFASIVFGILFYPCMVFSSAIEVDPVAGIDKVMPFLARATKDINCSHSGQKDLPPIVVDHDFFRNGLKILAAGTPVSYRVRCENNGYIGKPGRIIVNFSATTSVRGGMVPLEGFFYVMEGNDKRNLSIGLAAGLFFVIGPFSPLLLLISGDEGKIPADTVMPVGGNHVEDITPSDDAKNIVREFFVKETHGTVLPSQAAIDLADQMENCGAGMEGSKCLGKKENWHTDAVLIDNDEALFFSAKEKLGYIVHVENQSNGAKISHVDIYDLENEKGDVKVFKALFFNDAIKPVITGTVAENAMEFAKASLPTATDYRRIIHLSMYFIIHHAISDISETMRSVLRANYLTIIEKGNIFYQKALLICVQHHFEGELAILVATELAKSSDDEINLLANIVLANNGQRSPQIKNKIKQGLTHNTWSIRRSAVEGFADLVENADDQNLLIKMMRDKDSDVSAAAKRAVNAMTLSDENLVILNQFASDSNWSTRRFGIELIGRIDTPTATSQIVAHISDGDEDVRKEVLKQLKDRNLTGADLKILDGLIDTANDNAQYAILQMLEKFSPQQVLASLKRIQTKSNWALRRAAVMALGKDESAAATAAILDSIIDSDNDVRDEAAKQMRNRPLDASYLPQLATLVKGQDRGGHIRLANFIAQIHTAEAVDILGELTQHPNWNVRLEAIRVLGKAHDQQAAAVQDKASHYVIQALVDHDSDVRAEAQKVLRKYALGNAQLPTFDTVLNKKNATGRNLVVGFLKNIETPEALSLLIKNITDAAWTVRLEVVKAISNRDDDVVTTALLNRIKDSDGDVANAITTGLNRRSFSDEHISILGTLLVDSNWSYRVRAANYLGTTSSCLAVKILTDRLLEENDNDVLKAIRDAVKAVKGRNSSCS